MKRAVIIGQSHTVCMADALSHVSNPHQFEIHRLRNGDKKNDPSALSTEQALDIVRRLDEMTPVFLSFPGGYHCVIGLVKSNPDYDFVFDEVEGVVQDVWMVPQRVIASTFDYHLETEQLVRKVKQAAAGPVYILAFPPPKQDNEFMLKHLLARWNKPYRGQDIAACGLSRPQLRRKLWLLECGRVRIWAEKLDVGFVPAPVACFNGNGFLDSTYFANDATHANVEYGKLVLEQVASVVDGRQGSL
ncbi:hypothetical protein ACFOON_08835 [Novosphingobium piscinae]|uniref:SGNH/GDSL hydrolase family protein n=1 Tax=Novosphingobium piscinae TaxID=1507448 RepID=A0A7X1FXZ3_9SPHN|nr:hypothetical protein [Novosphingobium piscinae]MBC2669064.1 hypothetical protein [Novosphingobium piscinae]